MENGYGHKANGSTTLSNGSQQLKTMVGDTENGSPVRSGAVNGIYHDSSCESSDGDLTSPNASPTYKAANGAYTKKNMRRKASSPMAPAFMVSAPGKVIVYGEHAVVHGKAAMAAAISLRSYLLVTTLSKSQRTLTLNFRDIGLDHTWNIDELPWDLFHHPSKKKFYYDLVTSLDPELLEAIQPHIVDVSADKPDDVRRIQQNSARAFLYLFLSLGSPQTPGAIYTLRSTIPTGAGLGSSASVCVCWSAALLLQIRTLAGPHPDQPPDEAEVQIERINRWAFVGEMCIHGNPSGVDNTVSAGGKAVVFRRGDYSKPPSVIPVPNFPEVPLLLVNTKQPRSTAVEVAKVGALKKAHPVVTESMLNSIDQVTTSAHELMRSPNYDGSSDGTLEHLGALFRINHGLLVSLGVSHPRLERIRELVDYTNIGWTKLTGAGGGGCAITLLRRDANEETLRGLEQQLDEEGFERYEATLGGDGVGVLWPAVLRNGSDEDGGEEIDQQKFENAVGAEGIEKLVGVGGRQEKREGWKFWKRAVH
ncbi:hypothetical protein DTO027B5_2202 [Paecilomyces variotii]|nr:hypothetical protein DTO169C6_6916 [Paecilomyces variotii]KAJ9287677.1 hypothetical protein DTO021C3_4735 [Paecilomyces variotii]KAJ9328586.1 hypothetical protein DTO027B3_852 [Paecilomyces variotii]KAJ9335887.1 hypothetical protein DTO027B5_2202 [Paecilomyces variotii]KAJ9398258.1 hypothetical protein DTO282F9_4943 [Paecilomyces variotii]